MTATKNGHPASSTKELDKGLEKGRPLLRGEPHRDNASWLKSIIRASSLAALIASSPKPASAGSLKIIWNAPEVVAPQYIGGYDVLYGSSSGNYTNIVDVGTNTTVQITGLTEQTTYFFVCVTYNNNGLQSAYSNEINYTVPGLLLITPGANPNDPVYTDSLPARNTLYPSISATGKFVLSCEIAPGNSVTFYESPTLSNPSWTPIYKGPLNKTSSDEIFKITVGMGGTSEFFRIVVN